MEPLEDIGRRIIGFLDAALENWLPDREIPAAEALLEELLAHLPENDEEWNKTLASLAAIIAHGLQPRPHDWLQAVTLIAVYYDEAWVPQTKSHPRARKDMRRQRGELYSHPVELKLAPPLVGCLLAHATSEERIAFLRGIDSWDVVSALAYVLPDIDLSAVEMAHFLHHIDPWTSRDLARGEIFSAVQKWAGRHISVAKEVVDACLREDAQLRLENSSIQVLVEGVMASGADEQRWRDDIISHLVNQHDENSWRLAATLACFAWPHGDGYPSVEVRHATLLKHVKRLPARMIPTGLWATQRDAREFPHASIRTALQLWQLWPPNHDDSFAYADAAVLLANVAALAAWTIAGQPSPSGSESAIDWQPVLDILEDLITLDRVHSLDNLLTKIAKLDRGIVAAFLPRWLLAHRHEILEASNAIDRVFPSLANALGHDELRRYLVALSVHSDQALRFVAVALIAQSVRNPQSIAHLCETLSDLQVRALVYEVVGRAVPGSFWVPLLFALARQRAGSPQVVEAITTMLVQEAAPDYPGLCREGLHAWSTQLASTPDNSVPANEHSALRTAHERLAQTLQSQEDILRIKYETPELRVIQPSAAAWNESLQRRMQAQQELLRKSGQSLAAILPQVPIARGEASIHGARNEGEARFHEISVGVELPIRNTLDPVTTALTRRTYRRLAAELLDNPEVTP